MSTSGRRCVRAVAQLRVLVEDSCNSTGSTHIPRVHIVNQSFKLLVRQCPVVTGGRVYRRLEKGGEV